MRDLVRGEYQNRADQALHQADRGSHAPGTADDAAVVDVRVEYFGRVQPDRSLLQEDLLEADREYVAEPQDQQQDDHGPDCRQGHMPELPPSAASVDGDGLVELGVDA